jgi:hypothetical protein
MKNPLAFVTWSASRQSVISGLELEEIKGYVGLSDLTREGDGIIEPSA